MDAGSRDTSGVGLYTPLIEYRGIFSPQLDVIVFSTAVVKTEPFGMVRDAPVSGMSFHLVTSGQRLLPGVSNRFPNFPRTDFLIEIITELVTDILVTVPHTISNDVSLGPLGSITIAIALGFAGSTASKSVI